MKKAGKGLIRIVTATAVTIFSLFTGITGVYAWFKTTMSATIEASMFEVTNGSSSVTMGEVTLYKFVYGKTTFGEELVDDYANPNRGHVGKYAFDKTKGENGQFGYTTHSPIFSQRVAWQNPCQPKPKELNGYKC